MSEPLRVIAIDGPAASGKSTTARMVAKRLEWKYIDTGAMYRAIALAALNAGINVEDEADVVGILADLDISLVSVNVENGDTYVTQIHLDGNDVSDQIRTPDIADASSKISVHNPVRKKMVELQRAEGLIQPSVLEGRDIGTKVFPDAGIKVYLDASIEERARRRVSDYQLKGHDISHEAVRDDLIQRDKRDSTRPDSPLTIASDAVVIDTTTLSIPQQVEAVIRIARQRFTTEVFK